MLFPRPSRNAAIGEFGPRADRMSGAGSRQHDDVPDGKERGRVVRYVGGTFRPFDGQDVRGT